MQILYHFFSLIIKDNFLILRDGCIQSIWLGIEIHLHINTV